MSEYNFSPIVTRDSIFRKQMKYIYVYLNDSGDGHIHMYDGMVNLGFNDTVKINFKYDFEQKILFLFHHPEFGQTITQVKNDPNHLSVKCNDVFKKIGLMPLPPKIDGKSNSGKYLSINVLEVDGYKGVIVDLKQFV